MRVTCPECGEHFVVPASCHKAKCPSCSAPIALAAPSSAKKHAWWLWLLAIPLPLVLVACVIGLLVLIAKNQSDMTLFQFANERPRAGAILRLKCQLGTPWFGDKANHRVTISDDTSTRHISVLRSSPEGKQVYELLKDGRSHDLSLELGFEDHKGTPVIVIRGVRQW
jgi:hypothetical protein